MCWIFRESGFYGIAVFFALAVEIDSDRSECGPHRNRNGWRAVIGYSIDRTFGTLNSRKEESATVKSIDQGRAPSALTSFQSGHAIRSNYPKVYGSFILKFLFINKHIVIHRSFFDDREKDV